MMNFLYGSNESGTGDWNLAVSALAFNSDHSRLLVGNARGSVLEYDMKDGKLLRTLNDVHPPEAAILQLKVIIHFRLLGNKCFIIEYGHLYHRSVDLLLLTCCY